MTFQFREAFSTDENVAVGVQLFHAQRLGNMERERRNYGKIHLAVPHSLNGILGAVI